jgi:uncharacterized protein (TIGR03437 family)
LRNLTAANAFERGADGAGQFGPFLESERRNFAAGSAAFAGAQVGGVNSRSFQHGLFVGVRMPEITGSGLFLSPLGVLNAISLSPPTAPVSPGAMVYLFGSGFAESLTQAESGAWPEELGGVRVTVNGVNAPLGAVSGAQINLLVPAGVTGPTATVVVHKGEAQSNAVAVPLELASPAVVTDDGSGTGLAAMEPVAPGGEATFLVSGLGASTPLKVYLGGRRAEVLEVSDGPGPGLRQVRVKAGPSLPPGDSVPLSVAAGNGFTCLADAPVKR